MATLANPRHEKFSQELASGKSQVAAYRTAGFGKSTGRPAKLAKDPRIVARVAELMRAREEVTAQGMRIAIVKSGVNRLWVLERLRENAERALQAKPVLDAEGNPTGEYKYDGAVANRALELIGKEIGMFVDRAELRIEDRLARMTPEERAEDARLTAAEIRRRLEGYKQIEGEAPEVTDVTPDDDR